MKITVTIENKEHMHYVCSESPFNLLADDVEAVIRKAVDEGVKHVSSGGKYTIMTTPHPPQSEPCCCCRCRKCR